MSILEELIAEVEECARRAVEVAAPCVVNKVRDEAPVDTGQTRAGITGDVQGLRVVVTSTTEQGDIQNYGSGPYKIKPRGKKALFWPGADHPVAGVNHPGVSKHKGWWDDAPWEQYWRECLAETWN